MTLDSALFRDFAYVFVAALAGGLLAHRLRQPLILGYVVGGILIGPFTPGPRVSNLHSLELLAEIGVILLMYTIGIEFSAKELFRVKWVALLGAPLGIALSILLALSAGKALGWNTMQAVSIGAVISVASTMVLSRLLLDRGELLTEHGTVMIGITLVEDFAVVLMTVLFTNAGALASGKLLEVMMTVGKPLLVLVPVGIAAVVLVPPLMRRVSCTKSDELCLLVALALGFATAAITQAVGLSLALGAFLAGVLISGSEYSHRALAQLLPLRDAFVALFFVTVGALIDPRNLLANLPLLASIITLIVVGKFVVWTAVVWLFRYPFRTALLVGIGLTQIGEFSFILVQAARASHLVQDDAYNATLAASLVTVLLNAALVRVMGQLISRRQEHGPVKDMPLQTRM